MVILGGLEIVAAGYIIHKHNQNKKEKQRIEEEAAALEEQQYRIFPSDGHGRHSHPQHRRRRSHSHRRHSEDGKYRKESPRPPMPVAKPTAYSTTPAPMQKPVQRPNQHPQPQYVPNAASSPQQGLPQIQPQQQQQQQEHYPQDMKYGWTENEPMRPPQQQDPNYPPTGWPAHWEQSGTSSSHRFEPSRGRQGRRAESPHVRFGPTRHTPSVRSLSRSPPPSYRQ